MSYQVMGSMVTSVMVSADPDRSGNFVGDNTADDVEIQAAIDYVVVLGGGKVFIKRGGYAISARITVYDNVFIEGEGIDITTLTLDNGVDDIFIVNSRAALGDPKNENIHMSDLTLDGNGANQVSGSHIVANNTTILFYEYVQNFSFRRVKFYDGQDYNLRLGFAGNVLDGIVENCIIDLNRDNLGGLLDGSGQRITYINCEASNSALSGFWHWGKNITFVGCRSHDNASAGFGCEGTTEGSTEYVRFVDCISYNNSHGMQLYGCRYIQVLAGTYYLNNSHGIWVHSRATPLASHDVIIKGVNVINNNVSDGAFYGINISGRSGDYNNNIIIQGCIIADDRVTALQDRGIETEYCSDSLFENNIVYDHLAEGIRLNTNCDRVIVRNNIVFDNGWYNINVNNANCNDCKVYDNLLYGTWLFQDLGTDTVLHTREWLVTYGSGGISVVGDVPLAPLTNGQSGAVGFEAPPDLQQLVRAHLKVLPQATQAAANWDLNSDYGGVGEGPAIHTETDAATTYNVTNLQWYDIELVALGFFANLSVGDRGGIRLTVSTAGHDVAVFSLLFEYV